MRTKNLFRSLIAITFAIMTTGAFAQLTTNHHPYSTDTTTAGETVNYVSQGARVLFATSEDPNIDALITQGVLVPSAWKWTSSGVGIQFFQSDGLSDTSEVTTAGVEDLTGEGLVYDSLIAIDFPNLGTVDLYVRERSISNISGITGCWDNTPEHLPIQVVSTPTIVFNDADRVMGGCGADQDPNNDIPITVSGSGPFTTALRIAYNIYYTPLTGAGSYVVADSTIIEDGTGFNTGWANFSVNNPATNTNIPFNITDGNYGTYTVTLQAITDVISRKTLDASTGFETNGLPGAAQRTLRIYALPRPSTQPIKHIQNLDW